MLRDLRHALRVLAKHPGYAASVVATLAIGVGAAAAVFSIVHAVLVRPLPFGHPEELVAIKSDFPDLGLDSFALSSPEVDDLRDEGRFAQVAWWAPGGAAITGLGEAERVNAGYVSAGFFDTLGVRPLLGRGFQRGEDGVKEPDVVVISEGMWERMLGRDPDVLGRVIGVDHVPSRIVGVMPRTFDYPGYGTEMWVPLPLEPMPMPRTAHWCNVVARLAPGVTVEVARQALPAFYGRVKGRHPDAAHVFDAEHHRVVLSPLHDAIVGPVRRPALLLELAVLCVLAVVGASTTSLLLARAESRRRELAVRAALGASRPQLVRTVAVESGVLALLGGLGAAGVAVWGTELVARLLPKGAPRVGELCVDGPVLAFAIGLAVLVVALASLVPLVLTRVESLPAALAAGTRATVSRARLRFRRALVVTEVALAVVLLVSAGLLLRGWVNLAKSDPGFEPRPLLAFMVELVERRYPDEESVLKFWTALRARMLVQPGVEHATELQAMFPDRALSAVSFDLACGPEPACEPGPLDGCGELGPELPRDRFKGMPGQGRTVDYLQMAGHDVVQTLGLRLRAGRGFRPSDDAGAPRVLLVNDAFVRKHVPAGQDPLACRVRMSGPNASYGIVGVVGDIAQTGLGERPAPEVYVPFAQPSPARKNRRTMHVVLRASVPPESLVDLVRAEVGALDPTLPVFKLVPVRELLQGSLALHRFLLAMLSVFAAIALALAALAVYGLLSHTVSQRSHELGIRLALGARPRQLLSLVGWHGARLVLLGVGLGLVAGALVLLLGTQLVQSTVVGVPLRDVTTFVVVPLVVALAGLGACVVPARRALRVPPLHALRDE